MINDQLKQDEPCAAVARVGFCDSPRVSVIIPHFYPTREKNVKNLVEELKKQTFGELEVLIVHQISPQGRAINEGARNAVGSILIVMDDDTRFDQPELVENLVRVLDSDPRIAMAGASVVSPQDINGFQRAAARQFPRFNMPVVQEITDSDMACHGCVAFRRDVFEQVGMEREDILRGLDPDLRVRIRKAGYRVVLAPNAWVYHPLPSSLFKFLKLFYRNGDGAAYTQVFNPEINYDTSEALESENFVAKRSFAYRLFRFPLRLLASFFTFQWIRFLGYLVYLFGYTAGYTRYTLAKYQSALFQFLPLVSKGGGKEGEKHEHGTPPFPSPFKKQGEGSWSKAYQNIIPPITIGLISVLMLLGSIFYWKAGHRLIREIYEGKSIPFLNSLIQGQSEFELSTYLETGDGFFLTLLSLGFLLILTIAVASFKKPFAEKAGWPFAFFLCLGMVTVMYGRPEWSENETVYLIHPFKLIHPEFLRQDWTWGRGAYGHFLFELLASPLMIFMSPLPTALAGRLLVWSFLIYGMICLGRRLGLSWPSFAAGFAFWIFRGQSLAAGEWIFHGLEAKCVSYIFLFSTLFFILKEQFIKAGISSGLAIAFHSLVGGWGTIALLLVILFEVGKSTAKNLFEPSRSFSTPVTGHPEASFAEGSQRSFPFAPLRVRMTDRENSAPRHLFQFCALAFLFALPGLVPLIRYMSSGGPMTRQNYAIDVLFRGTHHMDPATFLSAGSGAQIVIYLFLATFLISKSFAREDAKKILIFLWSLMAVFGLGLWARKVEWLEYLYLYPFRLGPLFLLLFFSWSAFHFLWDQSKKVLGLLLAGFLIFEMFHYEMPQKLLKGSSYFFVSWKNHLLGRGQDDFDRAADWIQKNTPEESIFIAPPWEYRFWISARRAQVVSYKYVHVNASNEEWMERIQDLNGGRPFETTGGAAPKELQENFPNLSSGQILELKEKYQADYYLTVKRRDDLPFELIFSNDSYFLYQLPPSQGNHKGSSLKQSYGNG